MAHCVTRYHDISCGHRVSGHEGKCANLHGHNYRITFTCQAKSGWLDNLGRVIDFGEVKSKLCMWIEEHWDHKMLLWEHDPLLSKVREIDQTVVTVPFNPTAENMAEYLVIVVAPQQLAGTGIVLEYCTVEETRKCSASYSRT